MTMNKVMIAAALAACILPSVASAQATRSDDAMMTSQTNASSEYTIMRRSAGEMQTESPTATGTTSETANTNTDAADIQRTIDANPGLAQALNKEGVMVDQIGAISVEPNGQVTVYDKS